MSNFKRYGRIWYTTEKEANNEKKLNEQIYFDEGMNAYYNIRPKKSIWDF